MGSARTLRAGLAIVYLAAASLALYGLFARWHYDDPYITYRYADHLARGVGLVYNAGERVLSTTTPLFALLLAAAGWLRADVPAVANFIGCVSLAAGGLCMYGLGRRWQLPVVAWAGLLLYPTALLPQITLGSETPLYLALCLGAFLAYAHDRFTACAVCCALAILLRGDGVLVPAVIALHFVLRWRSEAVRHIPWRAVAVSAGLLLLWLIPAWIYFGQPVPATLAAKRGQGQMAISQAFAPGLLSTIWAWFGHVWAHRLEAALAVIGLPYLFWRGRAAGLVVAWAALYFAAYAALGVSSYYWYYAPLVPGAIVLAALGLTALADGARWIARRASARSGQAAFSAVAVAGLGALTLLQAQQTVVTSGRPDARYAIYRAAGEWLRANTPADASVGALEVGIIGYFADRAMVDFAGLIQPDLARAMRRTSTYDDLALAAAEQHRPRYVLMLDGILPRFDAGYVRQHCDELHRLDGRAYAFSTDLLIYLCQR